MSEDGGRAVATPHATEAAEVSDADPLEQRWTQLLLAAFFLAPVAFVVMTSRGLYYRDHVLFFRPAWWSIYTQLRRLELPIINLAHPAGLPHESSTNFALLTPNTALLFLGPFERSYDLFVLSHFAVLCSGAFVLARILGCARVPSLGLAVFLALAGPIVSFENLLVGLQGLAYTPWLLAALARCRRAPGALSVGLLGLASGFAAQGLMPELLLIDVIGAAFILGSPKLERLRTPALLSIGVGLLLGLCIASADLVPLVAALQGSERGRGFDLRIQEAWSLVPLQFLELFLPSLWSLSELSGIAIPAATGVQEAPYLTSLYLGIGLPLSLAGVGRKHRWSIALVGFAVVFFLVAMGPATPLHRLLSSLPFLRNSRYPVKYSLCALPFLGVLLTLCLRDLRARLPVLRCVALVHFLLLLGILIAFHSAGFEAWVGSTARPYASKLVFEYFRDGDPVAMALSALRTRVWPSLGFSAVLLILLFVPRFRGSSRLGPALVTTLALDLFVGAHFAIMTAPVEAERMDPAIRDVVAGGSARVFPGAPLPVPAREDLSPFESAVYSRAEVGQFGWTLFRAFASSDLEGLGSNPIHRIYQDAIERLSPSELNGLLAYSGVSRVVSPADLPWPRVAEARDTRGRRISVYEISSARPRIAAYSAWALVSSTSTRALTLLTTAPQASTALLWDAPNALPSGPASSCRPEARGMNPTPAHVVEVEVNSPCAALLVVQEAYRDRWRVEVDGTEAPPLQADAGYLAVRVPAGRHFVRFSYSSLFRAWLPVSLSGLAVALGLLVLGWTRAGLRGDRSAISKK